MKVDATRLQPSAMLHGHPNKRLQGQSPAQNTPPTDPTEKATEKAKTARQQAQAKGVVRLLQEGHFEGVAALRLRINFFDQISALEQSNLQETARQGATELARTVEDGIEALNSVGLFEAEPLSQIKELAESLINDLQAPVEGDGNDPQSTVSALEQALSDFEASVAGLLLPDQETAEPGTENPVEEIPPSSTEPAIEPESSSLAAAESETEWEPTAEPSSIPAADTALQDELLAGLDELAATFRSQLSGLQDDLQKGSLLSVPKPADNHGAAYEKFLAIYQQMQGVNTVDKDATTAAESATEA